MRVCDGCGTKMPAFKPRKRTGDGKLLCNGCHPEGAGPGEGRPVGHHGSAEHEAASSPLDLLDYIVRGPYKRREFPKICPTCGGHGSLKYPDGRSMTCYKCKGSGEMSKAAVLQFVAHDSGDGKIIYHCPFCGGGDVVGRSDGTAMCDFCSTAFTVQVQPERPAMPQTSPDGTPLNMPGMPGDPTQREPQPGETAPPGAGPPGGAPPAGGGGAAPPSPPPGPPPGPPPAQKQSSYYLTPGGVLDEDAYIKHLAIKYADDKAGVIEDVRQNRG